MEDSMRVHIIALAVAAVVLTGACKDKSSPSGAGISVVTDEESQKTILQIAAGSKDHTTLVKAVQAAGLENSLANQGPFTVFAPTDAAFKALPSGALDKVMGDKNLLTTVLGYHVYVGSSLTESTLTDGESIAMFDGGEAKISVKNGKITINDANVVASVRASNGMVHVIDKVLLPPEKK